MTSLQIFLFALLVACSRSSIISEEKTESNLRDLKNAGCRCGEYTLPKIVGGQESKMNSHPWMVSVCKGTPCTRKSHLCGGSIINNRYILTASHCFENLKNKCLYISAGDHDLSTSHEANSKEYKVSKIILHPKYDEHNYYNDIALLKLEEDIIFSNTISPICLPTQTENLDGKSAHVLGWGLTEYFGKFSEVLREVVVKIIPLDQCKAAYRVGDVSDNMFCAMEKDRDSCDGDSGGPLEYFNKHFYNEQIGIVSWGRQCANSKYPGVYTMVSKYLDFIKENTRDAVYCARPNLKNLKHTSFS